MEWGKSRGEVTFPSKSLIKSSHSISDGTYTYIWFNDDKTGNKIQTKTLERLSTVANTKYKKNIDAYNAKNENFDYTCSLWIPNQAMFVVPKDKKFTDMTTDMKNIMKNIIKNTQK